MNRLDELQVYQLSMQLSDRIWKHVSRWPDFQKRTIGIQLARAADSISANIAEGHGRYHFGERRQFNYYARGSLSEVECWITKCGSRQLIAFSELKELQALASELGKMLNGYIWSIGRA